MKELNYLKKLRRCEGHKFLTFMAVSSAVLVLAAIIGLIIKMCMRQQCGCEDCGEDHDCREDRTEPDKSDDCDENGCAYTNDKDFV